MLICLMPLEHDLSLANCLHHDCLYELPIIFTAFFNEFYLVLVSTSKTL